MQNTFILKSKRFWGIFITTVTAILPVVGVFFGWDIDPAIIVDFGEKGNILLSAIGGIVGVSLMIYGSMKAKGPMVLR